MTRWEINNIILTFAYCDCLLASISEVLGLLFKCTGRPHTLKMMLMDVSCE